MRYKNLNALEYILFLPTTYIVRGKVMFSLVSMILFGGGGEGVGSILSKSCLGGEDERG